MDFKALLKIGIVAGVLMNALDLIVQGTLMAGLYTAPVFRNPEEEIVYLVSQTSLPRLCLGGST